ncbi:MAG TPA: HPr-rel-A system PqqD family peptide chaperone [Gammaproteobacteria bacterium]|nr:HPr-rel-A system PqqD family peptide chaperone [Gammaproteobacteria bacterium]
MNTSSDAAPSWRARPADEVVWLALDDDYVLYHRGSGKTHFLNAASKYLLRDVLTTPQTAADAAAALARHEGVAPEPAFVTVVTETLEQLDYLGLIDRV